tara:strand:+ start:652 stop:861 length:210 start_codon:yes stop_codon:yes gene_type:complete
LLTPERGLADFLSYISPSNVKRIGPLFLLIEQHGSSTFRVGNYFILDGLNQELLKALWEVDFLKTFLIA